ncbi:MAG: NUDIX domain-containing protein [Chlamydiae bacterium]|jgi:8-oxo-dGTP pyrophosphatase MutT (NUDIX family)|nr:NUDIX domain-containing protein [Chlamydiota bacterium]
MSEVHEESFGIIPLRNSDSGMEVLLLLHKSGYFWGFPKGHKNPGEDSQETALRELREETGLFIEKIFPDITFAEQYSFEKNSRKVYKSVVYFPAFVSGEIKLDEKEILEAVWLPVTKAIEKLSFPESKRVCKKLLQTNLFT